MPYPGQEALPQWVWVDELQDYVRLYATVDEMTHTEYNAGVVYRAAFIENSFDTALGQTSSIGDEGDILQGETTTISGPVPGGLWTYVRKGSSAFADWVKPLIKVSARNKLIWRATWKMIKFTTIVVVGYSLAVKIIEKVWNSQQNCVDTNNDGECELVEFCNTSLFGGKTCTVINPDTGETWNSSTPDPIGDLVKMVGLVGAIGLGAYIILKILPPPKRVEGG